MDAVHCGLGHRVYHHRVAVSGTPHFTVRKVTRKLEKVSARHLALGANVEHVIPQGDDRDVLAFGVRVWRAGTFGGSPAPTAPRPFERIALRWENSFGGSAAQEAMAVEKDGETLIVPGFERHSIMNPLG